MLGENKQPQRAHLISQGKGAKKVYARNIIDSPYNMKAVCCLYCNNKMAVNHISQPVLADKIAEAIRNRDMDTINELLIESGRMKSEN
jgi:hypothetical protein